MTYAPTGYAAKTIALGVDVLCGITTWQTICSGNAAVAKTRCLLGVGGFAHAGKFRAADGSQQPLAAPLAQFALGNPESTPVGFNNWQRQGMFTLDLAIAPLPGATEDEAYLRMVDLVDLIERGYEAAHVAGTLVLSGLQVTGTPMLADARACPPYLVNCHLAQLTFSWSIGAR